MTSFSDKLKMAKSSIEEPQIMTLSLEEDLGMIPAYNPEDEVILLAEDEGWKKPDNAELYDYYDNEYYDDNVSTVDEGKGIVLSQNQINLTQENHSQYIPFRINRFYDGFDLATTQISFYWVNKLGQGSAIPAVDVYCNTTHIKFALLVDDQMTAVAGNLEFEIQAVGQNSKGYNYLWKTKPCKGLNVIQSLQIQTFIEPDESWQTNFISKVAEQASKAEVSALNAADYADKAWKAYEELQNGLVDEVQAAIGDNYYTKAETLSKEQIEDAIDAIDVSDQLIEYVKISDLPVVPENVSAFTNDAGYLTEHQSLEGYATEDFVIQEIEKVDISDELGTLVSREDGSKLTVEQYVKQEVENIDVSGELESYAKKDDVYTKTETYNRTEIDSKLSNISLDGYAKESYVQEQVTPINTAITSINETLEGIDKSPRVTYKATYGDVELDDGSTAEYMFTLWKNDGNGDEVQDRFQILGGGGGAGSGVVMRIAYVDGYGTPLVATADDKVILKYDFSGEDSAGDTNLDGTASWKVGSRVVKTEDISTGVNEFDLTDYVNVGDNKVLLTITHATGSVATKAWTVKVVDVRLVESFDDTKKQTANAPVNYTFIPYGGIEKTVHFILDGEEIGTKTSVAASSGLSDSYTIPAHSHGTHLLEVYMSAAVNGKDIESNHIFSDIIWYDEASDIPVISCVQQEFTARQYETTNIEYTVYDPSTENPVVTRKATYVNEEGETVESYNSTVTLETNTDIWSFKTDVIGEHTLTITCGETVKTLKATVTELGIEVSPVTTGLIFDFNPVGYSNNDVNRIWTDNNTGVSMTLSDNFDWVNGGYQIDENGDQYFCVKAGTTATVDYNLFADDAKENGKEFKVIFKTTNVKNRNTSFISCMDYGIGLDMKIESANIYSSNGSLYSPYCEDDIIEFEFNINKNTEIPMVMTYEDGVGNRPMIYTSDSSFWQTNATPITIGSTNCDVYIYRMRAYSTSLSDRDILNNFIADARNAEEMIARHTRNQIYKDGLLTPDYLAEVCPDLRIIMLDAPWFTNDKDNKVTDTNITMIYKNGDPILDNWTCTGATHRGQGTSSNEYGYAARNIDLVMDTDTSEFTLGDGSKAKTITLTRNSVPTDYLNCKVNVASSEMENNAENARDYSLFNPFIRFARWKDSKVKDCMEFFNGVIFIRERNEDISTHREFQDTNYHFYSLCNVGDSKKTDDTRVNDKNDPKEYVVEITDYNVPLAEFPTGVDGICPESEWKAGNTAYDFLYSDYEYEDGEFKSFGASSYEFRYEMKKITDEQRQENIDTWRDMYKFIVTSSDEEFYSRLKEWFVVDSALYFYLFTENRIMVDNRAKNLFVHYGKVYISETEAESLGEDSGGYIIDNEQAAIRNGYRYDLAFGYDFDTSYGIGNTGKLNIPYGTEDVDFYVENDPESGYVFRAAESTFFCRLRDLFKSEMQAMYVDRENVNAWSSSRTIKQWDDSQNQFPEELFRLHYQRLYTRTYQGISIDNSIPGEANPRFLEEMMNGKKKYQRRMFMRNNELYFATKYFGKTATQDQIMMRFNNPVGASIAPDFTLYITPFSNMYIGTSFGNVTPTNFRAKAGVEYTIPCSIESGTADITLIYGASFIQAIGDLSRCYVGDNDFSKASRLQSLVIGSDTEGYSNSFMTKISLGNNKLLEYLDIQNITGLNSVVDLSQCSNLLELYAQGSGATGVIFANGGKLEKAYIPAVVSLTMKNLNYIDTFEIDGYEKLSTLVVENTPFIDTNNIVANSPELKTLRLIGLNWNLLDNSNLEKVYVLRGISNTGGEIDNSILTGYVYVSGIKQYDYSKYKERWSDLEIEYGAMTPQFVVNFVNYDGTPIETQYVDQYADAVDPATREENRIIPVRESTVSTDYTFIRWDKSFTNVGNNLTVTALYEETTRQYNVKYVQKFGNVTEVLQDKTEDYGKYSFYEGQTPTHTSEEQYSKYYLFSHWDKSGYVNGDKIITAVYDECHYSNDSYFNGRKITDLKNVELYALTRLIEDGKISIVKDESGFEYIEGTDIYSSDSYSFNMGHDYSYDDLNDKTFTIVDINSPRTFTGTSGDYYDTEITVLDADRDFVLAVDYEFASGNTSGATLMECYDQNSSRGFKLSYVSNPTVAWMSGSNECAEGTNREMLVLRHVAGELGLHVYTSNLSSTSIGHISLGNDIETFTTNFSLIFGCGKRTSTTYGYYAKGTIHWAKLWYTDLGEQACRNLASYIHENVELKIAGFQRYFLENGEQLSSIDFVADKLLYTKKKLNDNEGTNVGGWANTTLNRWLNNRVFAGMPVQIQQLVKKVKVKSRKGEGSDNIIESFCHVYIPSISELYNSSPYNEKKYTDESDAEVKCISHFSNSEDRIMYDYDGNATEYWTRSPSDAGTSNKSSYFLYISSTGNVNTVGQTNVSNGRGVLIEFSI